MRTHTYIHAHVSVKVQFWGPSFAVGAVIQLPLVGITITCSHQLCIVSPLAEAPSLNAPPISLSPSSSSCFSSKNSSSLGLVLLNSFQLPAMHLLTHLSITSYLNTKAPKYAGSNHAQFVFLIFSFLKCGEALGLASRQSSGQSYKFYSLKYQFYGQRD